MYKTIYDEGNENIKIDKGSVAFCFLVTKHIKNL